MSRRFAIAIILIPISAQTDCSIGIANLKLGGRDYKSRPTPENPDQPRFLTSSFLQRETLFKHSPDWTERTRQHPLAMLGRGCGAPANNHSPSSAYGCCRGLGGKAGVDGAIMESALMGDAPAGPPHVMLQIARKPHISAAPKSTFDVLFLTLS